MSQAGTTAEAMDAGTTAGEIENGAELVIDVAGIVETPASLDESTTATEAAEAAAEEIPFDSSANTDAGIEPRTAEPATADAATTEATTEQAEPGNDVAEEVGKDSESNDTEISDDGEILRSSMDVRAHREYERRRNSAQSRVADAYLDMVSAKVAAKAAADHLTSEGEALEKIVAGGWRAIKREMEAAGRSASVYQDAADDAKGKTVDAIKAVAESLAEMHVDSIYGDSATLDAQAPSEAVSEAWKDCTIAELCAHGLTQSVMNRLDESGIGTIGKLAQFVEDLSLGKEKRWPKGIGEAKVTMIEDALTAWLTKNRDSGTFGAIPTSVGDEAEVEEQAEEPSQYPSIEAWDKFTPQQKIDWLGDRCGHIGGTTLSRESEKAWKFGNEAWHAGKNVDACEYYPGARCDDWLRGWVTGSMEPQRVKAAAVKKEAKSDAADDQPASNATSVDDLFG